MARRKKIVIGNWKMNPVTLREAVKIFNEIKKGVSRLNAQVIICPPHIYLNDLKNKRMGLGAQDVSAETKGSHTGEISAEILAKNGVKYVIIGHSERRAMGENNEIVSKKVAATLEQNLKAILCVGESKRDDDGHYLTFIRHQLREGLRKVNRKQMKNILVAYEPLFAIGNKDFEAMSPHDIHQMVIFIRKQLIEHFNDKEAAKIPIIYGGSVSAENDKGIIKEGEVDGFLVGRQSLVSEAFNKIVKSASTL